MKNHYQILEISKNATQDEVKKAYRKAALKYHPDHNPSDKEAFFFKEIKSSYEVLSNPIKRKQYDNIIKRQNQSKEYKTTYYQYKTTTKENVFYGDFQKRRS
jgi:curved DNA-binding protein